MAILIKLFGDLGRIYNGNKDSSSFPVTLKIKSSKLETVLEVIKLLGIPKSEISHIFVNGTFSGLGKVVNDGDRIGLFPIRMSLIFLEVTKEKTIRLSLDVYQEQEKNKFSEISLDMPEGSTLELVLKKLRIPKTPDKLLIQVNGEKIHDENHILKTNDKLIIKVLFDDRS
jgi:molybdopterin converting factor small subunit